MVSIRCTAKLLKKLKIVAPPEPPVSSGALGDWFATIIYTKQCHFLLLVSEKSRLPVILPARDLNSFEFNFIGMLRCQLLRYGASEKAVELEMSHLTQFYYGKTNSRSVLGTINDYTFLFRNSLRYRREFTIDDWADILAETPCGPLDYNYPKEVAVELITQRLKFYELEGNS